MSQSYPYIESQSQSYPKIVYVVKSVISIYGVPGILGHVVYNWQLHKSIWFLMHDNSLCVTYESSNSVLVHTYEAKAQLSSSLSCMANFVIVKPG